MGPSPHLTGRTLEAALMLLAFMLPVSIAGTNIALALVTATLLAHAASGRSLAWRGTWTPVTKMLCLYLAVAVLTSFTGVLLSRSLHNIPKDFHKLWVLLLLTLALRSSPKSHLPAAMAAGFVFTSTFGITRSVMESIDGLFINGFQGNWVRVHAYYNSVTFGELAGLGLLGSLALLSKTAPSPPRSTLLFIGLLTAALILNQTRGAFLGVLTGAGMMCVVKPALQRRWIKWMIAGVVLASLASLLRRYGDIPSTRLILWDVAWRMFQDHPWLGVGPSNYATVFTSYFDGLVENQRIWGSAHNIFFQHLAERGVIGLAALLALFWTFFVRAWRRARSNPDALPLMGLAAVTAFLVMNVTESAFQNEQITTFFLAIWAYAESPTGAKT